MKTTYKGFIITAEHANSGDAVEYNIIRKSDGLEIAVGIEYERYKIKDFIRHLKSTVNDFIEDPTAYYTEAYGDERDVPPDDYEPEIDEDAEPPEAEENEGGVGQ